MNSPRSSLDAALRKARSQVGKRRIFIKSFFTDFDHLNCGRITAAQFARVLANNDVHLTPAEVKVLADSFAPASSVTVNCNGSAATAAAAAAADASGLGNAPVLYEDFLAALDAGPGSSAAVRRSIASTTLTAAEEARLRPVCAMLQHAIRANGTSLTAPFRDLDPLRSGRVTVAQFLRCLPFSGSLPADAMELFAKQYSDGHGGVYYMAWCRAMDPSLVERDVDATCASGRGDGLGDSAAAADEGAVGRWKSGTVSSLVCPDSFTNPNLSADELIHIFRQQRALYRLCYEDAFVDYDKLRTGKVTVAQFESVLGRMRLVHFALRPENIATLAREYINDGSGFGNATYNGAPCGPVVEYRGFLRDTHPAQATAETADGQTVQVNFFDTTHAPDTYVTSADDQARAEALLAQLRALVQANRICLSPVLRDFDRVRKGIHEHRTCTRTRFARALATQNIMLPPEQLQLLIRKYTVPNPDGSPSSEVNYYLFVQDVDSTQASGAGGSRRPRGVHGLGVAAAPSSSSSADGGLVALPTTAPPTLDNVLRRVAAQVVARRLHIAAFFADLDPLRSGVMVKSRLSTALGQAGLQLPPEELVVLQNAFISDQQQDNVDTVQLTAAIEAAIAELRAGREAEKTAAASGGGAPTDASAKDPALAAQVASLLNRVRHNVRVYNALLMPFFADFDRHHRGVITPVQFAQACVRHHLPLTQPELDLLASWYSAGDAIAPGTDGVRYLAFVRDVGCAEEDTQASALGGGSAGATTVSGGVGGGTSSLTASARAALEASADVDDVLTAICVFLQERRPCLTEFFPDGDELRHHHVTPTRFRHCMTMLGLADMTEAELNALENAFGSQKSAGDIDYPAFVYTVRAMLADGAGVAAVSQRRQHGSITTRSGLASAGLTGAQAGSNTSASHAFAAATLARIQRILKSRRTATIAAFREYDRSRKGYVTEGQFFACLQALGVPLKPNESAVLLRLYAVGNGQVHYLAFAHEVDDESLIAVS